MPPIWPSTRRAMCPSKSTHFQVPPSLTYRAHSLTPCTQYCPTWLPSTTWSASSFFKGFLLRHQVLCVRTRAYHGLTYSFPGGLLVCLPADAAAAFIAEISSLDNMPAWIVGEVIAGACGVLSNPCWAHLSTLSQATRLHSLPRMPRSSPHPSPRYPGLCLPHQYSFIHDMQL
jgi:hypothetical protein